MRGLFKLNFLFVIISVCLYFLLLFNQVSNRVETWENTSFTKEELISKIHLAEPFLINKKFSVNLTINKLEQIFSDSLFIFESCKNGSSPLFTLEKPNKHFSAGNKISKEKTYQTENIPSNVFFSNAKNRNVNSTYLYYTSPIENLPQILQDYLSIFSEFELHNFDLSKNMNFENIGNYKSQSTLWMGSGGVIANCHFDRSHNIFIQLIGEKKWTLFPPKDWRIMYLFPSVHPSYHQAQVGNIESVNNSQFSLFDSHSKPFVITVKPGDIMYIPRKFNKVFYKNCSTYRKIAYWFHQVESLGEFSASLSIVSPSMVELIASNAQWESKMLWDDIKDIENFHFMTFQLSRKFIPELIRNIYQDSSITNSDDEYANFKMNVQDRINTLLLFSRLFNFHSYVNDCISLENILFPSIDFLPTKFNIPSLDLLFSKKLIDLKRFIISLPSGIREIILANVIEVS